MGLGFRWCYIVQRLAGDCWLYHVSRDSEDSIVVEPLCKDPLLEGEIERVTREPKPNMICAWCSRERTKLEREALAIADRASITGRPALGRHLRSAR